jgi:hypothetical protein
LDRLGAEHKFEYFACFLHQLLEPVVFSERILNVFSVLDDLLLLAQSDKALVEMTVL